MWQELLDKCHPLGMFDSIATLAVASSMRELYRLVLVDTPLAPYFSESLSAGMQASSLLQWTRSTHGIVMASSSVQTMQPSHCDYASVPCMLGTSV